MRKQLYGGDISVGVADAPRHERARIGLGLGDAAQPRHEKPQCGGIKDKPRDKRQGQPAAKITDHQNQGEKVDRHIHQDVAEDEANIPQCQRSLHDFGSHTAREFILIKIHALVKHQAMEVPSQPHRKVAAQHLVLEKVLQSHQNRAHRH